VEWPTEGENNQVSVAIGWMVSGAVNEDDVAQLVFVVCFRPCRSRLALGRNMSKPRDRVVVDGGGGGGQRGRWQNLVYAGMRGPCRLLLVLYRVYGSGSRGVRGGVSLSRRGWAGHGVGWVCKFSCVGK